MCLQSVVDAGFGQRPAFSGGSAINQQLRSISLFVCRLCKYAAHGEEEVFFKKKLILLYLQ